MSKITFRADEDLIERIESLDASKSEIMREALREYLDGREDPAHRESIGDATASDSSLDAVLAERVDELVAERLAANEPRASGRQQDVNVNVTLETDAPVRASAEPRGRRERTADPPSRDERGREGARDGRDEASDGACGQCGESLSDDHVYCPNCGEKAARRLFCECGDEVRSDWGFCPSCGRRTPAANVLDRS
ncbi:CopG family transcriptional regulator [Halobacteriales archaeon QS_1_67_19]|nr:MAG: CopG family transcriptional regulator [Halobacteriales archaeon QS_1_67_19]